MKTNKITRYAAIKEKCSGTRCEKFFINIFHNLWSLDLGI